MLDIDVFDVLERSNEGIVYELLTPDGRPTNVFFRILGQDSDAYQEKMWEHQNDKLAEMAATGGKLQMNAKENAQNALDLLSVCVTSWSMGREPWTGTVRKGGVDLPCTPENVALVLRSNPSWRAQTDAQVHNRANFMKGPQLH